MGINTRTYGYTAKNRTPLLVATSLSFYTDSSVVVVGFEPTKQIHAACHSPPLTSWRYTTLKPFSPDKSPASPVPVNPTEYVTNHSHFLLVIEWYARIWGACPSQRGQWSGTKWPFTSYTFQWVPIGWLSSRYDNDPRTQLRADIVKCWF